MFFDPSHCYCPYNMQTSRMVCEDHFQSSYCYPNPDLQLALQHLDSLTAVGVVEAYQATWHLESCKTRSHGHGFCLPGVHVPLRV